MNKNHSCPESFDQITSHSFQHHDGKTFLSLQLKLSEPTSTRPDRISVCFDVSQLPKELLPFLQGKRIDDIIQSNLNKLKEENGYKFLYWEH